MFTLVVFTDVARLSSIHPFPGHMTIWEIGDVKPYPEDFVRISKQIRETNLLCTRRRRHTHNQWKTLTNACISSPIPDFVISARSGVGSLSRFGQKSAARFLRQPSISEIDPGRTSAHQPTTLDLGVPESIIGSPGKIALGLAYLG